MSDLKELINPFKADSKSYRLLEALKDGPKRSEELIDMGIVKRAKRVFELAWMTNQLGGIKITSDHTEYDNPKNKWRLQVTDTETMFLRGNAGPRSVSFTGKTMPSFRPSSFKGDDNYILPPDYDIIRDNVEAGENVFLVGPSGSGKTELGRQVAKDTESVFIRQNFNGETTVDNMIGYTEISAREGVSITQWHDGELSRAVKLAVSGKRVVYLVDEVTAGKPEVLFQLYRIMERNATTGTRDVEINGEVFTVPSGMLTIIGASNTFRQDDTGLWQGTNTMNMAFANRWTGGVFVIDYAPNEDEILEAHGIERPMAKALQIMAQKIRSMSVQEKYPVICSTRQLISIGQKAKRWGTKKALLFVYLNTLTADEVSKIVGPIVKGMQFPGK